MKNSTIMGLIALFCLTTFAYANVVFPAIANQFMVSVVVRSYYSVIMAILILFIEATFIRKLFLLNFIWSFIIAFVINFLSSVAGMALTGLSFGSGRLTGIAGILGYKDMRLGTYLGLIPGYFLTVILEWCLLILVALIISSKVKRAAIFKTSVLMNLFSYIIIFAGIIIADIATGGQVFKTF
ncbi:MAG: hypothetical protein PHT31_02930 [Candidatus Omnitrophica bacterium]|nr:hypothetical protein [Candidatus Omnitrophota bacterium]MDD5653102.1 hypothetical protein [Candidatus Omnitrophota bacterium]